MMEAMKAGGFRTALLIFFWLAAFGPAVAAAQSWAGQGRLHGLVFDEDEKPLAGAVVQLAPADRSGEGPEPVTTDAKGRWAVGGLADGRWRLTVEAEGYIRSQGWAQVVAGPSNRLKVTLRPLTEVLPGAAETPSSVYGWLDKGNSLLEQGRPAEARAEYEKALRALPPSEQPEVLRAVARTHFLEKNLEQAVLALKRALLFSPDNAQSRALLNALSTDLGRGGDARTWLERLDAEGPAALATDLETAEETPLSSEVPALDEAPTVAPTPGRPGAFRTAFERRSPLSSLEVYLERHRAQRAEILDDDPRAAAYDLGQETFEVVVPEDYDPEAPHGLLVWVSPTPSGRLEGPERRRVLAERLMIWVGANRSGNRRARWDRIGLTLDAAEAMKELYNVDERRVYAGGYSGGGRTASALAVLYPEVFQGALLFMGCDYYKKVPLPDKPGAHWPAAFPEPPRGVMKLVRERNRFVFATGEHDFNRMQTRTFERLYAKDGFRRTAYFEIPGANHYSGFDAEWLAKFVDALDAAP